jgi:hypothetical protein
MIHQRGVLISAHPIARVTFMVLAGLAATGCRADKPLVIDDTTVTRPRPAPPPHRCSVALDLHEDPSQLAVRCAEEFVAAFGARLSYAATIESIGGGKPPRQFVRMQSFQLDRRAVALCGYVGGHGVVFRTSPPSTTGTMVDVPSSRAGLRILIERMSLMEGPQGELQLPDGCHQVRRLRVQPPGPAQTR